MQFSRFMTAREFARELDALRVFRHEFVGTNLLESLEATRLVLPRIRIHYPDPVARRFWVMIHDNPPRQLRQPVEPDGRRWDAAVDFDRALYRWEKWIVYGLSVNPLDDPEPRFLQFIERPSEHEFVSRLDRRVDVSNDIEETLYDDINFDDRYSTWQVLLAAEQADAGIHVRMNLDERGTFQAAHDALENGRFPEGAGYTFNLMPVHAARNFATHERALDAVVWFAEERSRALNDIIKGQGGRFRLSSAQSQQYEEASQNAARESTRRFDVSIEDLIVLARCFAERWSEWNGNGRPLVADAYKEFLGYCVLLARRTGTLSFGETRDRVGAVGGWNKPALDLIWPDWTAQEKERVSLTLQSEFTNKTTAIAQADIRTFVDFLSDEGLEAFFWRLKSFEEHALHGNEFAIEAMKSDIQSMAVVAEHIAAALGATEEQLFEKYKQLWRNPDVAGILKRGDVAPLARQKRLAADWPALKANIEALRAEAGGAAAADLVMAHRHRGGVHAILPEDDHFELEGLFVGLMRAALITFVEVRGRAPETTAPSH